MRIAVVANTSWYLFNFRLSLMRALRAAGHDVVAVGAEDEYAVRIAEAGIRHKSVAISGSSVNPLREIGAVLNLLRLLRRERVDLVLSYTPKGNIYSGLASIVLRVPSVPNISGLGRLFVKQSWLSVVVTRLYKVALSRSRPVFFQNTEDLSSFVKEGLVPRAVSVRLPGSGVDLNHFTPPSSASRSNSSGTSFLLVTRMLWEKGVGEFVDAARLVRRVHPDVRFQLLGSLDADNPATIVRSTIADWVSDGTVEYLGSVDDVRPILAAADCVVLPSYYREGVPRSLLEAAAMGIPTITTDVAGCRDVVDDSVTGFLCKPRDAGDLAEKMLRFLSLDQVSRAIMGQAGRCKMESEFDERIVIERYLSAVATIEAEMKS